LKFQNGCTIKWQCYWTLGCVILVWNHTCDFKFWITHMISDQIPLHSVQLHFEKNKIKLKRGLNRKEVPVIFVVILHFLVSTKSSMFNSSFRYYQQFPISRKTGESNLTQIYTEVRIFFDSLKGVFMSWICNLFYLKLVFCINLKKYEGFLPRRKLGLHSVIADLIHHKDSFWKTWLAKSE